MSKYYIFFLLVSLDSMETSLKDSTFLTYGYILFLFPASLSAYYTPTVKCWMKELIHGYTLLLSTNVLLEPFCHRVFYETAHFEKVRM